MLTVKTCNLTLVPLKAHLLTAWRGTSTRLSRWRPHLRPRTGHNSERQTEEDSISSGTAPVWFWFAAVMTVWSCEGRTNMFHPDAIQE